MADKTILPSLCEASPSAAPLGTIADSRAALSAVLARAGRDAEDGLAEALAVSDMQLANIEEGFLGVTNVAFRTAALCMSVPELSECLEARLSALARVSERARDLIESDCQGRSLKGHLRHLDDALCEFAGYFEALIVRLSGAYPL